MPDPLLTAARAAWVRLAGVPVAFPASGVAVVEAPGSGLCPPGWVGVVELGGAAIATAPSAAAAALVRLRLTAGPGLLHDLLPVAERLGPASLAYLDVVRFRPFPGAVPAADGDVARLLAAAAGPERDECGLADVTSPAFVVRDGADVLAASGYERWPNGVAHLCVLTAAGHRGRGLARAVASAAVAHALDAGLLPQWRARPEPSRRVAAALGFRELGRQASARLDTGR